MSGLQGGVVRRRECVQVVQCNGLREVPASPRLDLEGVVGCTE